MGWVRNAGLLPPCIHHTYCGATSALRARARTCSHTNTRARARTMHRPARPHTHLRTRMHTNTHTHTIDNQLHNKHKQHVVLVLWPSRGGARTGTIRGQKARHAKSVGQASLQPRLRACVQGGILDLSPAVGIECRRLATVSETQRASARTSIRGRSPRAPLQRTV